MQHASLRLLSHRTDGQARASTKISVILGSCAFALYIQNSAGGDDWCVFVARTPPRRRLQIVACIHDISSTLPLQDPGPSPLPTRNHPSLQSPGIIRVCSLLGIIRVCSRRDGRGPDCPTPAMLGMLVRGSFQVGENRVTRTAL